MRRLKLAAILCFYATSAGALTSSSVFSSTQRPHRGQALSLRHSTMLSSGRQGSEEVNLVQLKVELEKYLEKRREANADELAKENIGKTIGGSRSNPLLEFVSVKGANEQIIDAAPNVFDYDELIKYGFGNLATPIMKAGGRLAMYDLLGLDRPAVRARKTNPAPEKLVIDRTGETDPGRYRGLKLGMLDDAEQAAALERARERVARGEDLRPRIAEESFERPRYDNVGPRQTPAWTPEQLDEWGRSRGEYLAKIKREKLDRLMVDRQESLDLEMGQRVYSILAALLVALAFGQSTPTFLTSFLSYSETDLEVLDVLRAPAASMLLAGIGSSIYCGKQASEKKRNAGIWAFKGLVGGPLTVRQLRELPQLVTQRELNSNSSS